MSLHKTAINKYFNRLNYEKWISEYVVKNRSYANGFEFRTEFVLGIDKFEERNGGVYFFKRSAFGNQSCQH